MSPEVGIGIIFLAPMLLFDVIVIVEIVKSRCR